LTRHDDPYDPCDVQITISPFFKKERETMQHTLWMKRTILVASLALIPLILPGLTSAAEQDKGMKPSAEAQAQGLTQIAVGSVNDTLKACLGRIPQDASAGQLMLAEQNCQQVEVGRTINKASLTF
jgi:hypothetical protein